MPECAGCATLFCQSRYRAGGDYRIGRFRGQPGGLARWQCFAIAKYAPQGILKLIEAESGTSETVGARLEEGGEPPPPAAGTSPLPPYGMHPAAVLGEC